MRKLLVFIVIIFSFLCGLLETEASGFVELPNSPVEIVSVEENCYNAVNQFSDKYFISSNTQNFFECIFESFGSVENDNFSVNNFFISSKYYSNFYNGTNEYLLSNSFNPRAP